MGLSLEQLAHKVNISPMPLQRIEAGKSSPSVVLLANIAKHLNKPIHSFLEEPGEQKLLKLLGFFSIKGSIMYGWRGRIGHVSHALHDTQGFKYSPILSKGIVVVTTTLNVQNLVSEEFERVFKIMKKGERR